MLCMTICDTKAAIYFLCICRTTRVQHRTLKYFKKQFFRKFSLFLSARDDDDEERIYVGICKCWRVFVQLMPSHTYITVMENRKAIYQFLLSYISCLFCFLFKDISYETITQVSNIYSWFLCIIIVFVFLYIFIYCLLCVCVFRKMLL